MSGPAMDSRGNLISGSRLTLEDPVQGFLLCIDGDDKGFVDGRVTSTRSRPGPWERLVVLDSTCDDGGQDGVPILQNGRVAFGSDHGTYLAVDDAAAKVDDSDSDDGGSATNLLISQDEPYFFFIRYIKTIERIFA